MKDGEILRHCGWERSDYTEFSLFNMSEIFGKMVDAIRKKKGFRLVVKYNPESHTYINLYDESIKSQHDADDISEG